MATRFLLPVAVLGVLFAAFDVYRNYSDTQRHVNELMDQQAALALEFDLAIRSYVAQEIRPAIQEKVGPDAFVPETMSTSFVARSIFDKVRNKFPDYIIKFSSDNPRNPANQAGPAELEMIQYFNDNPEVDRWSGRIELGGKEYSTQFSARRMKESCLRCHGRPEDAPASLVERYGATAGFHHPVGDVVALDTIAIPMEKSRAALASELASDAVIEVLALVFIFGGILVVFRLVVARRLTVISRHFKQIAAEPDSACISPIEVRGQDEISILASSFNTLAERIHNAHASLEQHVQDRTAELAKTNEALQHEITERKHAEKELQEQNDRIQQYLNIAGVMLLVVGADKRVQLVNNKGCEILECSREEVVGTNWFDNYLRPEDRDGVEAIFDGLMAGETEPWEYAENPVLTKTGEERLIAWHNTILRDHLGRVVATLSSGEDITERKQAEEALRESEEKYRKLFEEAQDGILLADAKTGLLLDCNAAGANLVGREKSELIGQHQTILHPPDEIIDEFSETFRKHLNEAEGQVLETQVITSTGKVRDVAIKANTLQIQGRTLLQGMFRDISDRKKAEQALRESEERHRAITETAQDAIVTADAEGNIRFWNSAAEKVFGFAASEVVGKSMMELIVPPQYHQAMQNGFAMFRRTGHGPAIGRTLELTALRKNGTEFPIEISVSAYRDHDGFVSVAVIRDITERKRAEQELKRTKRAAEAANCAKSEFLANMSHEIRTPMTAILGFADVLLEHGDLDDAPPERVEAAKTIKRNGEYLLGIINDILDLSKIEAGKLELERIRCSPSKLIANVQSLMRIRADAKGLSFDTEYIGAIPETIHTDPTRLRQILINLLANAIKFTETGGVRLVTRLVDGDGPEPTMQFDVVDTGVGMTEEQVAQVFQPFVQADTSTTRRFGGTGLGLPISKRLAEMLGGEVALLDTKPGCGTRFRLNVSAGSLDGVRRIESPMSAGQQEAQGSEKSSADSFTGRLDCRVLLVEDAPDNQRLVSFFLKQAGAEVVTVENGREAVDKVLAGSVGSERFDSERLFDVILMDMQMPVMDGYEATKLLRRRGYTGPIIALTAHTMTGDREKCLEAGCDDYAGKPVNRAQLLNVIASHLMNHLAATS